MGIKGAKLVLLTGLVLIALVLASCTSGSTSSSTTTPTGTNAITPSVTVNDQSVERGKVIIADVLSIGPGWIAIQADNNGQPGDVLGETAVPDGDSKNVSVTIDPMKSTPVMYAVLYSDGGKVGTFEPNTGDYTEKVGDQPVQPIFNVTGGLPSPTASATPGPTPTAAAILMITQNSTLGSILVDQNGMTLYYWKRDAANFSNCIATCLTTWPPFLTNGTPIAKDPAIAGVLGIYVRPDGRQQVTYDGYPLYYYSKDTKAGDTNGQGNSGQWFVFPPAGIPTVTPTVTPTTDLTNNPPTATPTGPTVTLTPVATATVAATATATSPAATDTPAASGTPGTLMPSATATP